MGCTNCSGNPNTWCTQCMPAEDTWVAPVDKLPDVFMGDRDHMYLLPNGDLFILSPDRTKWIKVNGVGGGETVVYKAGDGINIAPDKTIVNTKPNKDQTLTLSGRTLSISDGNSVQLPESAEVSVVAGKRIKVTKEGNAYTVSGIPIGVVKLHEKDKDPLVTLEASGNDDNILRFSTVALTQKITELEKKKQTISKQGNKIVLSNDGGEVELPTAGGSVSYDDTFLRNEIKELKSKSTSPVTFMAKGDILGNGKDKNIRVTKDDIVNAGTIKVGDTVVDHYWNKELYNIGMFKVASVDGNTVTLNGVNDLTYNHPKQSLTLADRTLSISEGNSVTLPNDKQTISRQGNKLVLSNGGGEVDLPTPNNATPYDDTALKKRVSDLEARPDNDKQTLTVNNNTLSISGGNSVTLPSQSIHRFYDGDISGNADTTNTRTVQKTNFRNPDGIKVGDTVEDFYSDKNTINRGIWKVIEVSGNNVKVQGIGNYTTSLWKNLTFNANTRELSLSGGNKVTLPQYVSPQEFTTLKNEYNQLKGAFEKLLQDLKGSGAWKQTGGTIFEGNLYPDRHIATGNINLFGGTADGSAFIRTNNGKTENDLAGGIS